MYLLAEGRLKSLRNGFGLEIFVFLSAVDDPAQKNFHTRFPPQCSALENREFLGFYITMLMLIIPHPTRAGSYDKSLKLRDTKMHRWSPGMKLEYSLRILIFYVPKSPKTCLKPNIFPTFFVLKFSKILTKSSSFKSSEVFVQMSQKPWLLA